MLFIEQRLPCLSDEKIMSKIPILYIWLFLLKPAQNCIVIVKLFFPLLYDLASDKIFRFEEGEGVKILNFKAIIHCG